MKNIYFIRHGKAGQDFPAGGDFARTLTGRGRLDAMRLGEILHQHNLLPDALLASPAARAKETAERIAENVKFKKKHIHWIPKLYLADANTILHVVREQDDAAKCIFLIGHNPGITDIANLLLENASIEPLGTCGIAGVLFRAKSWHELQENSCHLIFFDTPKN